MHGWTKQDGPEHIVVSYRCMLYKLHYTMQKKFSNLITVLGYCYVNRDENLFFPNLISLIISTSTGYNVEQYTNSVT